MPHNLLGAVISYHDSCWSDAVNKLLREEDLLTWGHFPGREWYDIVDTSRLDLPEE
jgi:hypothetical protein